MSVTAHSTQLYFHNKPAYVVEKPVGLQSTGPKNRQHNRRQLVPAFQAFGTKQSPHHIHTRRYCMAVALIHVSNMMKLLMKLK